MSIKIVRNHFLTSLTEKTDMRVLVEGENFTPKGLQDYPFARFSINPRESVLRDIGINYTTQQAGLAIITFYFSRGKTTVDDAMEIVEEAMDAFPIQNTVLDEDNQLLVQAAWIESVRHEDNVFGIPLFVRWQNFI